MQTVRVTAPIFALGLVVACGGDDGGGSTTTDTGTDTATAATGVASSSSVGSTSGDGTTLDPDTTAGSTGDAACPVGEQEWRSQGRDPDNTRYNPAETTLTSSTVAGLVERWSLAPLDGVTSTPTVAGGIVYFSDWSGDVHARCLANGDEIWTTDVAIEANASLLITDDAVFVPDARGSIHGLDRATGEVEWTTELDDHPAANIYSSPVLAGDRLIIGVASTELASIVEDYVFRGSVVALDPGTGEELWRVYTTEDDATSGAGVSVWSTAAVDEARGVVYIGTGNTYEDPAAPLSDSLIALDLMTGGLVWSQQFTAGDVYTVFGEAPNGPDSDVGASPNLFAIDGQDVVGVGDKAGNYMVLDRDSGELVWMRHLTDGSPLGGVMVTAAVGEGAIFVASNVWNALFVFDDPTNTSTLFALRASDGQPMWQVDVPGPVLGGITLAADVLYHGDSTGRIYARDAATGAELWTDTPGGGIGGGFSVVDGRLLVGHGFSFFTAAGAAVGGFVAYGLPE
jgi:polyvinyl alcohol dehydrogenase (cytochrome)